MYVGLTSSKDKLYALFCALPFFQLYLCLYLATYSQFWSQYCALFLAGLGNWLTHATGHLNLMSSSKSKYHPTFADPFIFCAILYADNRRMLPPEQLVAAYLTLIATRTVLYVLFMRSMVIQICDYCQIPFIRVKQDFMPKVEDKKKK